MLDFASLTLVEANAEQALEAEKRSFQQWNRGLSLEQYLKVYNDLHHLPHATDGKLSTWVLVRRGEPASVNFLCACETYRRKAFIATTAGAQEVSAYAIASVYTPEANRKKGYARQMLRLLHHVIGAKDGLPDFPAEWGQPPSRENYGDGLFSVLYSDVGPNFYRACGPSSSTVGWVVQNPTEMVWTVDEKVQNVEMTTRLLREGDLEGVLTRDASMIEEEVRAATSPCCSFTANNGVNNYLVQRSIMQAIFKGRPRPEVFGAVLDDASKPLAFATWTPGPPTLSITRLRASPETLPALLGIAKRTALQFGSTEVVAWAVEEGLEEVGKTLGGVKRTRSGHLPAIHVYARDSDKYEWLHNEEFAWC